MTSFGLLALNPEQEKDYFFNIAKYGASKGFTVYLFTPFDIDPHTEKISGRTFNAIDNKWETSEFDFPEFIYDRCFYSNRNQLEKAAPIITWLKHKSSFIGHGLPNKLEVYQHLLNEKILQFYLPSTIKVQSPQHTIKQLKQYKNIVLKPINGSQGKGVIRLTLQKDKIELLTTRHKKAVRKIFLNKGDLFAWLEKLFTSHDYMLQPYISLTTRNNEPFDLRILLQKDAEGIWSEKGRGIRIGESESLISNLHGGGTAHPSHILNQMYSASERVILEDEINTIIELLPKALESKIGPLFELGIDIGIDKNNAVWLIDINSKPGHQVLIQTNATKPEEIYQSPIEYCKHLSKTISN